MKRMKREKKSLLFDWKTQHKNNSVVFMSEFQYKRKKEKWREVDCWWIVGCLGVRNYPTSTYHDYLIVHQKSLFISLKYHPHLWKRREIIPCPFENDVVGFLVYHIKKDDKQETNKIRTAPMDELTITPELTFSLQIPWELLNLSLQVRHDLWSVLQRRQLDVMGVVLVLSGQHSSDEHDTHEFPFNFIPLTHPKQLVKSGLHE